MALDPKSGAFSFDDFREPLYQGIADSLGPTQRAQLRKLAEPGEPLWLIQRDMVEYARAIEKRLAQADFNTADGITVARRLQAEGQAVNWQMEMWERLLSEPVQKVEALHGGDDLFVETEKNDGV